MPKRVYGVATALVAMVAVMLSFRGTSNTILQPPLVPGKNNTVLFIVAGEHGISNVHYATSYALLENHPDTDVHFASFEHYSSKLERVSSFAQSRNPTARPIKYHTIPGPHFKMAMRMGPWGVTKYDDLINPPGLAGSGHLSHDLQMYWSPWPAKEHHEIVEAISGIINDVDPSLVVLDIYFRPGSHAARLNNRLQAILMPNPVTEIIQQWKPWTARWTYPAVSSGIPYPVPWHLLPLNAFLALRWMATNTFRPLQRSTKAYLAQRGIHDFHGLYSPGAPIIAQTVPEAALPYATLPANVTAVPSILLSVASAKEQDPELTAWLGRKSTVLVNLGSTVLYTLERATIMAHGLAQVLETVDVQVVWKILRDKGVVNEAFLGPLTKFVESGQVRIEDWLEVDPPAILETGQIVAFVHHGGANCYYEAVWAGVPHIILPMWVDHYDFATLVEYRGLGVWASKRTAPHWNAEELASGLLTVLDGGNASVMMKNKAKEIGELTQSRGHGRDHAAREIARLAASGL